MSEYYLTNKSVVQKLVLKFMYVIYYMQNVHH